MELRRLASTNPNLFFTRSLTSTLPLYCARNLPPPPPLDDLLATLTSILSNPGQLDAEKSRQALAVLSPDLFHHLFCTARSSVHPKTALNFFSFAASQFKFPFSVGSYSVLLHILVSSNLVPPARLLLIRVIDAKVPVSFGDSSERHVEIARALVDADGTDMTRCRSEGVVDLLVHVLCTQFSQLKGLGHACDVFRICADVGTCSEITWYIEGGFRHCAILWKCALVSGGCTSLLFHTHQVTLFRAAIWNAKQRWSFWEG